MQSNPPFILVVESPVTSCETSLGLKLLTYKMQRIAAAASWVILGKITYEGLLLGCLAHSYHS